MQSDTTMILFLNASQTTALYDLQVALIELRDDLMTTMTKDSTAAYADEAIRLYSQLMRPTYEPEKN